MCISSLGTKHNEQRKCFTTGVIMKLENRRKQKLFFRLRMNMFFFCLGIQLTENKHINIYFIRISLELFQGCWYQQRHTYYKDRLHLNSPYLHENILKYIKSCEP